MKMKLTGNRCQCTICDEYFNSIAAFDKHRYWIDKTRRGCDTSKLVKNAAGYWVTRLRPSGLRVSKSHA